MGKMVHHIQQQAKERRNEKMQKAVEYRNRQGDTVSIYINTASGISVKKVNETTGKETTYILASGVKPEDKIREIMKNDEADIKIF